MAGTPAVSAHSRFKSNCAVFLTGKGVREHSSDLPGDQAQMQNVHRVVFKSRRCVTVSPPLQHSKAVCFKTRGAFARGCRDWWPCLCWASVCAQRPHTLGSPQAQPGASCWLWCWPLTARPAACLWLCLQSEGPAVLARGQHLPWNMPVALALVTGSDGP